MTCRWFALCDRPAVVEIEHPLLGKVPACARCARLAPDDARQEPIEEPMVGCCGDVVCSGLCEPDGDHDNCDYRV